MVMAVAWTRVPKLTVLAAGEKLGAFGLTEPGGGSDADATRTTARLDSEEWVINGSKAFITNSGTDITAYPVCPDAYPARIPNRFLPG
jgi:alkylation response protein AidB-like acyl-CoA dehydrogenase